MDKNDSKLGGSLLPSLVESFGIIFIGYLTGKIKVFSPEQYKGLSGFVQYLALPSLVFSSISTISFNNIQWSFIAAIFVAKTIIFVSVVLLTLLLTNPKNIGKAGIYGIASTQSNDFALGYPLLVALYTKTHPNFPDYIYIIAPIQLIVLNIIGIFFLEMEKHQQCTKPKMKSFYILDILKGTLTNSIVVMTLLGIIWNFIYGNEMPPLIGHLIKTLSCAFPAIALFLLGITMAEKTSEISNFSLTSALVITKILVLPIILQKLSIIMFKGSTNDTIKDFSSFGFLYGTIPTAPTAFVFAVHYETAIEVISSTIIFSTLFSAPLIYTSATVIELTHNGFQNAQYYLTETICFLSIINLICCIWLLSIFLIGKRWHSISFGATIYIVFSQFFSSLGGILLFFKLPQNTIIFYAQYVLTTGGFYTTQMFALFLAVLLFIMRWKSLCYILQTKSKINFLVILICLIVTIIACLLTTFLQGTDTKYKPNFQMGYTQVITTFVFATSCLAGTLLCLILQHFCYNRTKYRHDYNLIVEEDLENQDHSSLIESTQDINEKNVDVTKIIDVEDIGKKSNIRELKGINSSNEYGLFCKNHYQCSDAKDDCIYQVLNYNQNLQEMNNCQDNHQISKHVIFLISLSTAMILRSAICFWKLIMEATNGIYIELEFMDVIINYSQGIICFLIFGFDSEILKPVCKKWIKLKYFFNNSFNKYKEMPPITVNICNRFKKIYSKCKIEIGQPRILNGIEYNNTFMGSDLVDWLIEEGFAQQRCIAESYGKQFLCGNIIEILDECDDFYDNVYVYKFTNNDLSDLE